MFRIYDEAGNKTVMHHKVDVEEALKSGRYFTKDPTAKKTKAKGKAEPEHAEPEHAADAEVLYKDMTKEALVDHAKKEFGVVLNITDGKPDLIKAIEGLVKAKKASASD